MPTGQLRTARPGEIDGDWFDRYSLAHAGFGFVCGRAGLGFALTMALAVGFEIAEPWLKRVAPLVPWRRDETGMVTTDSAENQAGDLVVTALGWWVAGQV